MIESRKQVSERQMDMLGESLPTYPGQALDGCFAGTVGCVFVQSKHSGRARRADDLASLTAFDHPLRALLSKDERCPNVHLRSGKDAGAHAGAHAIRLCREALSYDEMYVDRYLRRLQGSVAWKPWLQRPPRNTSLSLLRCCTPS